MELFNNIKNSIYSPKFYQDLLAKPFSFSVRYFVLLALIVSLIGTINFSFTVFPAIKLFVDDLGPKIINYYPNDLQLTINKGQVSGKSRTQQSSE